MMRVKDYWVDLMFSCRTIDSAQTAIGVGWLYKNAGLEPPKMVFVDSPLIAQKEIAKLEKSSLYSAESKNSVRHLIIKSMREWLGFGMKDLLEGRISQLYDTLCDEVNVSVYDPIKKQTESFCTDGGKPEPEFGINLCNLFACWDLLVQLGHVNSAVQLAKIKTLFSCGFFEAVFLKEVCFIVRMPQMIRRDSGINLHSKDSAAVNFHDGFRLHFWHGLF